jgi:hypothetical protein
MVRNVDANGGLTRRQTLAETGAALAGMTGLAGCTGGSGGGTAFTENQGESLALQRGDESDNSSTAHRSKAWLDIPRHLNGYY